MLHIKFLLDLSIILLSTKILGILTRKFQMPQVVGALIAGLVLGPTVFNVVHETDFISKMAELGVIILMFNAGLQTDIKELKKAGRASFIIALVGVIVPLLGGFLLAGLFNNNGSFFNVDTKTMLENVFIGVVLTATSVSITVETLQELGKLKTPSGTAILGAAVIDDILGIVILTIVTSLSNSDVVIGIVLLKIVLFFILAFVIGIVFYHIFQRLSENLGQKRRLPILCFVFCLILSFVAEQYFGVADITGAYIAGIVLSNTYQSDYISRKMEIVSYMLLSPIFFASIGIKTSIKSMSTTMIVFTLLLLLISIISKVVGCGLGAKICKYSNRDSLKIGVGMISRGEVALIVANIGVSMKLLSDKFFAPVIIVVIVTTLITPILLKIVYKSNIGETQSFIK